MTLAADIWIFETGVGNWPGPSGMGVVAHQSGPTRTDRSSLVLFSTVSEALRQALVRVTCWIREPESRDPHTNIASIS